MEISPFRMLRLLIGSLKFGMMIATVCDIQFLIRLLFRLEEMDPSLKSVYEKKTPFLKWRQLTPKKKKIRTVLFCIQDLFLWGIISIGIVLINFSFNDGKNRIFTFLGILIGFLIYRILLKKAVRWLLQRGIWLFDLLFSGICYIIFHPISIFLLLLCEKVKKIVKKISKAIAKKKKKEYNLYVKKYFYKKADFGFFDM